MPLIIIRSFILSTISACLFLAGCSTVSIPDVPAKAPFETPNATGRYVGKPVQCVQYARSITDFEIYGDAHQWWDRAAPHYQRGQSPKQGSILVLSRTNRMRHGHVAVVKRVLNPRQIEVTHSNWGSDRRTRSMIYDTMRVEDISARNDWSQVRFWNYHANSFGFPYAARGFIYQ